MPRLMPNENAIIYGKETKTDVAMTEKSNTFRPHIFWS